MKKKSFTVFLVSNKQDRTKTFHISGKMISVLTLSLSFLCFFLLALLVDYTHIQLDTSENKKLREKNFFLENKLSHVETRLIDLERNLHKLQTLSAKIKTITNSESKTSLLNTALGHVPIEFQDQISSESYTEKSYERGHPVENWRGSHIELRIEKALVKTQLEQVKQVELLEDLSQQTTFLAALPSISPVKGWLSSVFGYRKHPITGQLQMHSGIDIASSFGKAVQAPGGGVVSFIGYDPGYGKTFFIDHGYGLQTRYAHLSDIFVKIGQRVKRGDVLATIGSTGRSTGPHIHYEIRLYGVPLNPVNYILDLPLSSKISFAKK